MAIIFFPSPDIAADDHNPVVTVVLIVHVAPPSVETYSGPLSMPARTACPSDETAVIDQSPDNFAELMVGVMSVHDVPPFSVRQTPLVGTSGVLFTATMTDPLADIATSVHSAAAPVEPHDAPPLDERLNCVLQLPFSKPATMTLWPFAEVASALHLAMSGGETNEPHVVPPLIDFHTFPSSGGTKS